MESQLRSVSSGQPQLFAEIVQCHDLRALPEHTTYMLIKKLNSSDTLCKLDPLLTAEGTVGALLSEWPSKVV
jgi:hypothetical protein